MIRKTKKILIGLMVVLLAFCCVVGMAFGMTGCSDAADTKGIQSTAINGNGELVVTYTDGTSENLGVVVGSDGKDGTDGKDGIDGEDGKDGANGEKGDKGDKGDTGADGEDGTDGRGILSVTTEGGKLIITYTDGTSVELDMPTASELCDHAAAETVVIAEHDEENEGTYLTVCNDCGAAEITHGKRHKFESHKYDPTCTEDGYTIDECIYCGYSETDPTEIVPALGHDFDEGHYVVGEGLTICEDGGTTVSVCTRCGETSTSHTDPTGHRSDEWEVTTRPTTASEGEIKGTCINCGQYVAEKLPALNETDYVYEVTDEKDYCADTGSAVYTYEKDGMTFEFEVTLEPTEHILGGKPASEWANEDGTFDVTVPGIEEFKGSEATCADGGKLGKGYYTCEADNCGELVYVDTHKPHDYTGFEVTKEPTCTEEGERTGHCADCGEDVTEPVDALGHNYEYSLSKSGDDTFTLTGTCTRCDDKVVKEGLKDVASETIMPATCESYGLIRYTYTDAETSETVVLDVETAMLSHTLAGVAADTLMNEDGTFDTTIEGIKEFKGSEATCGTNGANGKGYYTCEECGEMIYVDTHKQHNFADYEETPATCTEEGERTGTCLDCGEETSEILPVIPHSYEYTLEEGDGDTFTLKGVCSVCGDVTTKEGITDVTSEVVEEATCTSTGILRYTYKDIATGTTVSFDAVIPMEPHTLGGKYVTEYADEDGRLPSTLDGLTEFVENKAECGEVPVYGKGYYTCETCNELVYADTYKDHSYTTSTVTKNPTCTEAGIRTYTCDDCGGTYTEAIDPIGHNRTVTVTLLPDEENVGSAEAVCSNEGCTEKTVTIELPVLGSEAYETTVVTEASCSQEGVIRYSYKDEASGVTVTFELVTEMVAHSDYVEGTTETYSWVIDDVRYTGYICEDCDKMIVISSEPVETPEEPGAGEELPEGGESETVSEAA